MTHLIETILGHPVSDAELAAFAAVAMPIPEQAGADVWYFDDPNKPAKPLTTTGFGNQFNWGVRDLWAVGKKDLFLGTANGWQFFQPAGSEPARRPGWQLYQTKVG